jgi:hypothetical protein
LRKRLPVPPCIILKLFRRKVKSKLKRKAKRRKTNFLWTKAKESLGGDMSYENIINKWLPVNISYILSCEDSDFHIDKVVKNIPDNGGVFKVPREFSIVDHPNESYKFIQNILGALVLQKFTKIDIDYSECKRVDLGAQVLLDIILKDIILFFNRCKGFKPTRPRVKEINGVNFKDKNVQKLLFSVGSPAIHSNSTVSFPDIIPYKLCIHDREVDGDPIAIREQKDLDTTRLIDYVIDCLKSLGRTLTGDKLDDLSTVIGEILINAEEHSTTKYRFSIGYFHKIELNGRQFGVFRLAILNFGKTIYEKFKDPNCPNKSVVANMKALSERYTTKKFFFSKTFEEETLWTLYALQDGVTSVAPDRYKRRGTGSIAFIESFFNIKGKMKEVDEFSRMAILSGNTNITFDGTYNTVPRLVDGEEFKFMTFNKSGSLEDKPDQKYVKYVDRYFPGTIISAKILFNEDDLIEEDEIK